VSGYYSSHEVGVILVDSNVGARYWPQSGNARTSLVKPGGMIVDLKGMWRHAHIGADVKRFEI